MVRRVSYLVLIACVVAVSLRAQTNRVDVVAPSAPELAAYGKYAIGVQTLQVTDKDRPDILNTKEGAAPARDDRTLTIGVWYPVTLAAGQTPGGDYRTITRDPAIATTLHGKAVRDAAPLATDGPFPLVIVSHGYPGNYMALVDGRPNAFAHYGDGVWDTVRMNNILDHFATAFFDLHLKGEGDKQAYLDPGWKGFKRGTTAGLTLEHATPK
jgi:hypothetical protein